MKSLIDYNRKLKGVSQNLRSNMTDAERVLWRRIRRGQIKGVLFYRQKPIGGYIVDFYCPKLKLIVEIDGDVHFYERNIAADKKREEYFNKLGLKIVRCTNLDVIQNIDNALRDLKRWLTNNQ